MENTSTTLNIPPELLRDCGEKKPEITITGAESLVIYVGGLRVVIKNSRPGGLLQ